MSAPTVRRVHDDSGSHVEPPLEDSWSDLEKLQWLAAVVLHDGGAKPDLVTVHQIGERFSVAHRGRGRVGSMSAGSFDRTWLLLTGIGLGLELAAR